MATKVLCLVALLLCSFVYTSVAQTCAEQVLGGDRGISANINFGNLPGVLPQALLLDNDANYRGQIWPILTIDSLTVPSVFVELDCSRESLWSENCQGQSSFVIEQSDRGEPTIVRDGRFGFLLGGNRRAFSEITCPNEVQPEAKLETALDISLGSFSISGSNEDGQNECDQNSGLEYRWGGNSVDIRSWAGRGFILTFRDFEEGKISLLATITLRRGGGANVARTFNLTDTFRSGTNFFISWTQFGNQVGDALSDLTGLDLEFLGRVDDDYGISLFSTFSHFVTGNLNAGCEGEREECISRNNCEAVLTGRDQLFDTDVTFTFNFSEDYEPEGIADPVAWEILPYNSFDWLRYVTCNSDGYFWFPVNPGVYSVSATCRGDDVIAPNNAADFCVRLFTTVFGIDSQVVCENQEFPEWGNIQCLSSSRTEDGPYCERPGSDGNWPTSGRQDDIIFEEFVPCINFPFDIIEIGLELECSVPDKDCAADWPVPSVEARDPICNTEIEADLVSDETVGTTCEETRTWRYRADNGPLTERCEVSSTSTDTTAPEWTQRPSGDKNGACNDDIDFDVVRSEDDCSEASIDVTNDRNSNRCRQRRTRTWRTFDVCGNENPEVLSQTLTTRDEEPPVITSCPRQVSVSCGIEGGALTPDVIGEIPEWTDDCQTDVNITVSDESGPGCDECEEVVVRTWTVDDLCSGTDSCEQQLSIQDRNAPTLFAPKDAVVDCWDDYSPDALGHAVACDDCDPKPSVFWKDEEFDTCVCATCEQYTTYRRTWWAVDRCENRSPDYVQTITASPCPPCESVVKFCTDSCARYTRWLCDLEGLIPDNDLNDKAERACAVKNVGKNCFNSCTHRGDWEPWPMGPVI